MNIATRKTYYVQVQKERFFLRFHMSLILIGTALFGLLASIVLMAFDVDNIVIRFPVAVIFAYLAFFGFVKLWLLYISSGVQKSYSVGDAVADTLSSVPDFSGGNLSSHGTFSGGGGGLSGGGGASGSFEAVGAHADICAHDVLADAAVHTSHGVGDAVGDVAGEAASALGDEGAFILVILGVLLAVVFGLGLYVVYDAPFILSEVAFDFILAASLMKSSRKLDDPDWKGSILRTTWKPFMVALLIAFIGAVIIHANYPEVHKLSEIFRRSY
jgi:hypothetical protein